MLGQLVNNSECKLKTLMLQHIPQVSRIEIAIPSITNLALSFRAWYNRIEQAKTCQDEREKLAKACSDSEPDNEIIRQEVIIHLKLQVYKKGHLLVDVVYN